MKPIKALSIFCCWLAVFPSLLSAQGRQLGTVDASSAISTAPFKAGTAAPATCSPPQLFFDTDAVAGANVLACTATNTWTTISGVSGLSSFVGSGGAITGGTPTDPTVTLGFAVSAKTANYSLVNADRGSVVKFACTDNCTATLPQAGGGGDFPAAWFAFILNTSTDRNLTIDPTTSTIDGAALVTIGPLMGTLVVSDGTNYFSSRGIDRTVDPGSTITAATYTVLIGDRGGFKHFSNATGVAVTLPQAGTTSGLFPHGWYAWFHNRGVGPVVITPTTSDIDAVASITLYQDEGVMIVSNGTSYRTNRGQRNRIYSRAVTGTSDTILNSDLATLVTYSNASPIAVSLPQAGTNFPNGWHVMLQNIGAGAVTITPTTSTIDGAATLALDGGSGVLLRSNGTNYHSFRGMSTAGAASQTNFSDFAGTINGSQFTVSAGRVRLGNFSVPSGIATGAVTFTASVGSDDAKVFIDSQGQLTVHAVSGVTASVSGAMIFNNVATPTYPQGSIPLYDLTVTATVPTVDSDDRAFFGTTPVLNGTDISCTMANGACTLTAEATLARRGEANNWTNTNDFSAAAIIVQRGTGAPSSASCDSAGEVGGKYVDDASGGLEYFCKRTGASSYAWTDSTGGVAAGSVAQSAWFPFCGNTNGGTAQSAGIAMGGASTTGPALATNGSDPWKYCTAGFEDAETNTMILTWIVPSNWNGSAPAINLYWQTGSSTTGTAVVQAASACVAFGAVDISSAPSFNTTGSFTGTTVTTANFLMKATISSLNVDNCAATEMMFLRVQRLGSDGADTMTGGTPTFKVIGLEIQYTVTI